MTATKALPEAATLNPRQLASFLGRSAASLYRDAASGRLPKGFRLGGRRYWLRSEIVAWLEAGSPAASEWEQRKKARA